LIQTQAFACIATTGDGTFMEPYARKRPAI
jgi:hypothetical protein